MTFESYISINFQLKGKTSLLQELLCVTTGIYESLPVNPVYLVFHTLMRTLKIYTVCMYKSPGYGSPDYDILTLVILDVHKITFMILGS